MRESRDLIVALAIIIGLGIASIYCTGCTAVKYTEKALTVNALGRNAHYQVGSDSEVVQRIGVEGTKEQSEGWVQGVNKAFDALTPW